MFSATFWKNTWILVVNWLLSHFVTWHSLFHLVLALGALVLGSVLVIPLRRFIRRLPADTKYEPFFNWLLSIEHLFKPAAVFLFTLLAQSIANSYQWQSPILRIITSFLAAWFFVKLLWRILHNMLWAKVIGFTIWFVAILHILNLFNPFIDFLDSISFTLGDLRISLYTLIQGVISLFIFVWAATRLADSFNNRISKSNSFNPVVKVLITKLSKITLIGVAILVALKVVGINLTSVAVFSGALGVGIGFGLQKVISNLFCGVLLLVDKSLKPGDVIEIDNNFGWVKSMSARFVSIQLPSGKEILVPNEDIITQKVINWSFSTRLVRVDVAVGVSYSADIDKAMELITEAARNVERVLKRPQPVALLKGFGDSSVELVVWAWINDPEKGVEPVLSDIRIQIWRLFKENGVAIPFPQRDLHIKSMPAGQQKFS